MVLVVLTFVSLIFTLVPPTLTLTLMTGIEDGVGDGAAAGPAPGVSLEKEMPSSSLLGPA
ncbi:Uncharacterised protein [Chlamydia trachomatis]|nr:Uncharacterised protein [Chlamydia trachomatis]CRH89542.1 Uncharacterised protein [Chlamydia trachomatis]